jgi:FMN-dependent NADH-azoreductase
MARLLHIEASPRGERSYSTRVAHRFVDAYLAANPGDEVEHLPLFEVELPEFGREAAFAKMAQIENLVAGGRGLPAEGAWAGVHREVARLKAADKVLISSPMWNYSVPYRLKHYIDIVCQPGISFYVNREGRYVGMVRNKPMQLILARGSEYPMRFPGAEDGTKTDYQRAYLEHIARFVGFSDIRCLTVQPTADASPAEVAAMLETKLLEADAAARAF